MVAILLLTGLGSGWVLGGNQTLRAGEIAPQPVRMLLSGTIVLAIVVLLMINISAEMAESHVGSTVTQETPVASATQQEGVQVQLSGETQFTVGQTATQPVKLLMLQLAHR